VLLQPGIKIGRTDPKLDPKGALRLGHFLVSIFDGQVDAAPERQYRFDIDRSPSRFGR
jgi:hypothetical protein